MVGEFVLAGMAAVAERSRGRGLVAQVLSD